MYKNACKTAGTVVFEDQWLQSLHLISSDTICQEISTRTGIFCYCMQNRILGPVYNHEKENWRILTNKEMYAVVKKPTVTDTVRLG
jgi:hypothetical protein